MTLDAIRADWTDDGFLGGRLRLLQPAKGYRAGIDAVMLAACVPAKAGEKLLEAGLGVGVASLCLAARVENVAVSGIELQPELAEMAHLNAERNRLSGRLDIINMDLRARVSELEAKGLRPGSFDHVFSNPPYFDHGAHALPPDGSKAIAHAMETGGLAGWVRFCSVMVKPKGSVTLVHRAEALPELLGEMGRLLGGLEVFPLWPRAGVPAGRVLVRGIRGSRSAFRLHGGLVLHGADNKFTPPADAVLRAGAALVFA